MNETSLKQQILTDMKTAMKEKNQLAVQTLRLVSAECKNQEINSQGELSDSQIISILRKQLKQYQESVEQYEQAGRAEAAQSQRERQNILQTYLPKPLSDEELKTIIQENIQNLKADSMKHMGMVVKAVQTQTKGAVESRRVAELVKEKLQSL